MNELIYLLYDCDVYVCKYKILNHLISIIFSTDAYFHLFVCI